MADRGEISLYRFGRSLRVDLNEILCVAS